MSITGNAAYHAIGAGLLDLSWPIVVLVGAVPAAVLGLTAHPHALRSGIYASIALPAGMRERITEAMDLAVASDSEVNEERRDAIKKQVAKLDHQEGQYLDLVGDPEWPRDKIAERLRRVRDERARLQRQLEQTERPDLDAGRAALGMVLELLTQPEELYRLASERARRVLNQALFTRLYVDADEAGSRVTGDEPTEPFAPVINAHRGTQQNGGGPARSGSAAAVCDESSSSTLLATALAGGCSSNDAWVEVAGIEPASFGDGSGLLRVQPA